MQGAVTLDAQNVTNRGTVAGNAIDIKAANDIANVGGRIAGLSNKGVDGSATDDSRVTLNAGGDILVASTTQMRSVDTVGNNGTSTSSRTNIDRVATIAGGNVFISAKGNFTARAAQVDAAANLTVLAGKTIDIAGVEEKHALFVPLGGNTMGRTGYTNEASISNVGSNLTAGNDVTIRAVGNATLSGSQVAAANDVSITGANVTISAVKDRSLVDVQTAGRKQYDRAMNDDESLSGGVVSAGNNVTISATGVATGQKDKDGKAIAQVGTGNLVLNAANVTALKGTAGLLANNDVSIQTVATRHDSLNDSYSRSGNLLKSTTTTASSASSTKQAEGSSIAGNSVVISAGNGKDLVGNVNVIGSSVLADTNLTVTAGADINVLAATSNGTYSQATSVRQSGLSGAKNGIGLSAGSSTVKTRDDGSFATQSETGSVLGSTGGNVTLNAGKNATIAGSDLIAGRLETDTTVLNGNIAISAQNIDILPGQDKRHETSSVDTASKSLTVAVVGTPVDTLRNLKDIKKDKSKFGRVNGALSELADSSLTAPQVAVTFGKSQTSSSSVHDGQTQSGSGITAAGDIRLTARGNGVLGADGKPVDGDITVRGSKIDGGGAVKLSAERNITVEASTDRSSNSSAATASGSTFSTAGTSLGDITRSINGGPNNGGVTLSPYNQKRGSDSGNETSTRQTASLINGNTVELVSNKGDILVQGSGIKAKGDIALTAKDGRIDIVSGQDGTVLKETHNIMQLGDLGGNGTANTVGIKRGSDTLDTRKDQQNTIRSGLSAGGNLAITAKDNVAVRGSDLRADGDIDIKGKSVLLDPGVDEVSTKATSQSSQFGVTVALSGYAVDAANAVKQAAVAHEQKDDDKLAGIYAVKAAITVANGTGVGGGTPAANNTQAPASSQASIKATVSIGGNSSDSTTDNSALQNQGSTVNAGQSLTIVATGDGGKDADGKALNGDITARGAVLSGKDVTLDAARDITLGSARDTSANDSRNSSQNASVGVGFGLGGTQNGFTLELAAGQSRGNANGDATTNQNTSVTASNVLTIKSGKDTTLAGAQVRGDKVVANIGGDLNIVSLQDTDNYTSREKSSGGSVSICVPPFCYGASSGSVNAAKANTDSVFAGVNQQSGIYAGAQGFDVTVKNNTDLIGGVIASAAGADRNRLTTGTLTHIDVKNAASYDSDSSSVNLSYSSGASAIQTLGSNAAGNMAGNVTPTQNGNAASTTKSAIGAGTLVITDAAGQIAATGKTAEETVAATNRDTANSAGAIAKIFDQKKLLEDQEYAKALSGVVQQSTAFIETKLGDVLVGTDTATKVAVHAVIDGVLTKLVGGDFSSGAAASAATTALLETFGKDIESIPGLNKEDVKAVTTLLASVVGTAVAVAGGADSAAGNAAGLVTGDAAQYNYLTHRQTAERDQEFGLCNAKRGGCTAEEKKRIEDKYEKISESQTYFGDFVNFMSVKDFSKETDQALLLRCQNASLGACAELAHRREDRGDVTLSLRGSLGDLTKISALGAGVIAVGVAGAGAVTAEAGITYLGATGRLAAAEMRELTTLGAISYCRYKPQLCLQGAEMMAGLVSGAPALGMLLPNPSAMGGAGLKAAVPEFAPGVKTIGGGVPGIATHAVDDLLPGVTLGPKNAGIAPIIGTEVNAVRMTELEVIKQKIAPCCFAPGTLVATPTGYIAIEALKQGDQVWTRLDDNTGEVFASTVTATHIRDDQPIYRLTLKQDDAGGQTRQEALLVTPGHPFYIAGRGFVSAIDLKAGDRLTARDESKNGATVTTLELVQQQGRTHNLTVDLGHTFFVGAFETWVHNVGPCAKCINGMCSIHTAGETKVGQINVNEPNLLVGKNAVSGLGTGSLSGPPTKIPPLSNAETTRSLIRENESAVTLSGKGYHVEQNPVVEGIKNPDYRINGVIYDNYAPATSNTRSIWTTVDGKVQSGQANNIVVNLADSKVNMKALEEQFATYPIQGLQEVIVIDAAGHITIIKGR
ncbi:hemagglutinin repeat-containing protein [Massilia sp. CCM 9210]|uniref:hemagglutinin repeat-containing protein n=1 Tax=Massilia scottii TaxID=3057166 RepID=UPI0027969417|nr:hemagglutinin repeat-containing protein [Massilia sp. CCM 9210]MDQ1816775.1 hemagglutinin repeat-containing protein [Massilia sp. CCM 9210]